MWTAQHDEMVTNVRRLLADRNSPEAIAMFELLARYAQRRVSAVNRRHGAPLTPSEQDEAVSECMLQLIQGSLATFRGSTVPELFGFVRTIADRTLWRIVGKRRRERALIDEDGGALAESLTATIPSPDHSHGAELDVESPLSEADCAYLMALLRAGSKAELARRAGVSRAAVTQRVGRIRMRVRELSENQRVQHDVWLHQAAHGVIAEQG